MDIRLLVYRFIYVLYISGKTKMKPMGFSNLEQLEPLKVINFMIPLLNHIFSSIEKIRDDFFKRNIEINDNILDSPGKYLNKHTDLSPMS